MGLQDLCPEILFRICELFCEHCQEQWQESEPPPEWWQFSPPHSTLLMLSPVCKSIGPIAQRVLHHHFGYVHAEKGHNALALLCRTISNKPELGEDLRWANLSARFRASAREDIVQGWLPKAINKFSRHLLNGGQGIEYRALLAPIILLQAPNLERLEDDGGDDMAAFDVLNHDAVIRDRALPSNLRTLRLGNPLNGGNPNEILMMDLSWGGFGGFIDTFKKLESLTVFCPLASVLDKRLSFQSLRVLRLYQFHMPRKDFENLILRIPHLEEFAISPAICRNESMPDPATVPEILQVLA